MVETTIGEAPLRPADERAPSPAQSLCAPRELFCELFLDPESSLHWLEPARAFLEAAFARAQLPELTSQSPHAYVEELVGWAQQTLEPVPLARAVSSWPVRVVRELGPVGLSDGVWLSGGVAADDLPKEQRRCLLDQLAIRLGSSDGRDSYRERYAALLQSVGVTSGIISRWDFPEAVSCTDLSYERALLGLALGSFPGHFGLEMLGFNLWMAALGPAPILDRLSDGLRARRGDVRYIQSHDRANLSSLAARSVLLALGGTYHRPDYERVARGFCAAHVAYLRWEAAMLGPNVPFTPWDSVLEMIKRKARFAADHHRDVRLAGRNLHDLLMDGRAAHEWLVEKLAASPLIRPGAPEKSRFMTHTLSIEGPMFDAFTASEKEDLKEWIANIGTRDEVVTRTPLVPLAGHYVALPDEGKLSDAAARYARLTLPELRRALTRAERQPEVRVAAAARLDGWLAALERTFDTDPRLAQVVPPEYSERAVVRLLEEYCDSHQTGSAPAEERGSAHASRWLAQPAVWLRGTADARLAEFEDCRWLFAIHAAGVEHSRAEPRVLEGSEGQASDDVAHALVDCASLGMALNTRKFLPEILGLTLASSAHALAQARARTGLEARPPGAAPSVDTLVTWSLRAVQAFMRRVRDGAPGAIERQWRRVWRVWRCYHILTRGEAVEREPLLFALRAEITEVDAPRVASC
jgi:hypothetical protein